MPRTWSAKADSNRFVPGGQQTSRTKVIHILFTDLFTIWRGDGVDASFSRALNPVDRKTGNMFLRTYGYPLPREVLQAVRDLFRRQERDCPERDRIERGARSLARAAHPAGRQRARRDRDGSLRREIEAIPMRSSGTQAFVVYLSRVRPELR